MVFSVSVSSIKNVFLCLNRFVFCSDFWNYACTKRDMKGMRCKTWPQKRILRGKFSQHQFPIFFKSVFNKAKKKQNFAGHELVTISCVRIDLNTVKY